MGKLRLLQWPFNCPLPLAAFGRLLPFARGSYGSKAVSRDQQLIQLLTCTRAIASHAVLTLFAPSMMGAAQPAYPASLSKA